MFFLTKKDLELITKEFETRESVKYIKSGNHNTADIKEIKKFCEFENMGIKMHDDHQTESFLVIKEENELFLEKFYLVNTGEIKYAVYQRENLESIVFWPGGLYKDNYLIHGHTSTIHNNDVSKRLLSNLEKSIRKYSKKINGYYIGEDAMTLYGKVRFITIYSGQKEEFDFEI